MFVPTRGLCSLQTTTFTTRAGPPVVGGDMQSFLSPPAEDPKPNKAKFLREVGAYALGENLPPGCWLAVTLQAQNPGSDERVAKFAVQPVVMDHPFPVPLQPAATIDTKTFPGFFAALKKVLDEAMSIDNFTCFVLAHLEPKLDPDTKSGANEEKEEEEQALCEEEDGASLNYKEKTLKLLPGEPNVIPHAHVVPRTLTLTPPAH